MNTLDNPARRYAIERWRRGEITPATRDSIGYTLRTFSASFGARPLHHLGPKSIDRWLETISDRAPSTRRNYLSRVRHFCQWLVAEGAIRRDPTTHVPRIRQPRRVPVTLTGHQIDTLFASLPNLRAQVVVSIMAEVGARCIEVSRLRAEDYDPDRRTLRMIGKGGHERDVPVPARTCRLINAYLDEIGVVGGPLIRSTVDPRAGLAPATLSHYVRHWMTASGVKRRAHDGRSAHGLRRTCGSDVMDACGDVQVVQAVLGHARIETTARYYLRPVPLDRMRTAMEAGVQRRRPPPLTDAA